MILDQIKAQKSRFLVNLWVFLPSYSLVFTLKAIGKKIAGDLWDQEQIKIIIDRVYWKFFPLLICLLEVIQLIYVITR